MKKNILILVSIFILTITGCNSQKETLHPPTTDISAEKYSVVESDYYANHSKLDNSFLYVSPNNDYCIQLPTDTEVQEELKSTEYTNLSTVHILSYGSISIALLQEKYIPANKEKLQKIYTEEANTNKVSYTITDFQTIIDNNKEIGRSYILTNSEGATIIKQEYKYNDNTIVILGQPFDNDECYKTIKMYVDTFSLLHKGE